jgi:S1-C subfamily serine protease
MLSKLEAKIVLVSLLLLVPVVGGLTAFVMLQVNEQSYLGNDVNGYVEPKWLGPLIDETQESLVTINCSEISGSGFAFDLDSTDLEKGFSFIDENKVGDETKILTNAHVIQNCLETGEVKVIIGDNSSHSARIIRSDALSDLALLSLSVSIKPLVATYTTPQPGYWVMALGSPHDYSGSVTFGNVINADQSSVYSTASLSPGNSGGPLLDNEGWVFGINSGSKPIGQNFNISISVNMLCEEILECPTNRFSIE